MFTNSIVDSKAMSIILGGNEMVGDTATGAGGEWGGTCETGRTWSSWSGDSIDATGGTTYYNRKGECCD